MAVPAVVTGSTTTGYVGLLGINKPEWINKLVNKYGDQGADYLSILQMFGFSEATGHTTYNWTEDDWRWQTVEVLSVSLQNGATTIFRLAPASVNANGEIFPQVNDTVSFNAGGGVFIEGSITAIAGLGTPNVDITVQQRNVALPTTLAPGDLVMVNGNSQSEGGDGATRKSIRDNVFNNSNTTDIVYTKFEATGSQWADGPMWFDGDINGAAFLAEYIMGQFNSDYRHSLAISMKLLTGMQNSQGLVDPFNPPNVYFGTQGLLDYMANNANLYPYTPGTLSLADDNQIARIMERNICGKYNLRFIGQNLDIETEDYLVNFLAPTQTSPATIKMVASEVFQGNEDMAMTIGFNYFVKGRFCHMLHPLRMLNHPQLLGATGYNGQDLGLIMTMGKKKVSFDGGPAKQAPAFGMRYKAFNGYSRQAEIWEVGGAGPGMKTNLVDARAKMWRSEIGGHQTAGNQMIYMFS